MQILSHRGYHVSAQENTLEAFEQAIALKVDGIETDIRLSADGLAVLLHDRYAPNGEDVSKLRRIELERLVGHPIPTVEEAVERFGDILWNLEIKTPAAVAATVALVRRFAGSRQFLISSFLHPVIEEVSKIELVDVECALLIAHRPLSGSWMPDIAQRMPQVQTIVWNFDTLDDGLLAESVSHQFRNYVYGVQTQAEHERVAGSQLDGIITDRPDYLLNR